MRLSKEELKKKVSEIVTDNDIAIQLLEDIEDSFELNEADNTELSVLQEKYEELQEKYKTRFLQGNSDEPKKEESDQNGLEEEEIVDIKEI